MKTAILLSFALFLSLISTHAIAQDWIITESDYSTIFVGKDWIKALPGDADEDPITMMYHTSKNMVAFIDEDNMQYAIGPMEDYCNGMKAMTKEMNDQMTEEQQKMMKDMLRQQAEQAALKVTVKEAPGVEITGYKTTKYSIFSNGDLFEEKWISNEASLKTLISKMKHVKKMLSELVACAMPDPAYMKISPEFSEAYKKVDQSGFVFRSIRYEFGEKDIDTDVLGMEKENIDPYEFEISEDYNKVSFLEIIKAMSGQL